MAKTTQELNQHVTAIKIQIEDGNTGAPASYHVINNLNINIGEGYPITTLTIASYYSQKQQQAHKHPMMTTNMTLVGMPPRGADAFDWAYRSLVAPVAPDAVDAYGSPVQAHQFTGAELVLEAAAPTATDAG